MKLIFVSSVSLHSGKENVSRAKGESGCCKLRRKAQQDTAEIQGATNQCISGYRFHLYPGNIFMLYFCLTLSRLQLSAVGCLRVVMCHHCVIMMSSIGTTGSCSPEKKVKEKFYPFIFSFQVLPLDE